MADIKEVLFTLPHDQLVEISNKYKGMTPKPLSSQFENRASREQAITKHNKRKKMEAAQLFPRGIYIN